MDPRSTFTSNSLVALGALMLAAAVAYAQSSVSPSQQPPSTTVFGSEITVTATGTETVTEEVPAPTTVISREEIDNAQVENVADLLRRVPGVIVMGSGDEGKQTSVFTRGTNSNQTLVLFDGVRLNSPYFGGYDASLLTTSGLEQVEVARGPYSALWGADALGGVINLIPRRPRDATEFGFFGEGGEHGWQRYEGDLVLGGEHLGLYLSGLYRKGEGELDNSDFGTEQLLADVGWSWGSRGSRLAVVFQDLATESGIPFTTPGEPTPDRRQWSDQRLLAVPLRWSPSDEWTLELMAALLEREFRFRDPADPWGLTATDTAADTSQARLASHHDLGGHRLSWGGEWREDEVTDGSNFGANLEQRTSEVSSAFLQDVWNASNRLRLIMGVRWDSADDWGDEYSPRIHLGWMLTDELELRAGYGEAFRQPSLGELFFPISGNPALRPERSKSYEVDLAYAPPGTDLRWELNLFATDLDDLIQFDFIGFENVNIGTAEIRGAELIVDSKLTDSSYQLFQVTWIDTEDDVGNQLLRRPEWSGSLTIGGLIWYDLRGDLTILYVGSRDDVDPVSFDRIRLPDHFTTSLALAWQAWDQVEITLRVVNLTDTSYEEVAGYPAPGRRFAGGLRIRL
jgi:outer membrane cobalamin receptor